MKKIILVLILFCFMATGCSFSSADIERKSSELGNISVTEVKKIIDNYADYPDVSIIDVRSEEEYASGHIEKSLNIPLDYINEIQIDTNNKLIVYCQSGRRSKEAFKILKKLGYESVLDMGGINSWPYELVYGYNT